MSVNKFDPISKLDSIKKISCSKLKLATRMVYVYLVSCYNNNSGQCDPSQKTIARELSLSTRTVQRAIRELKEKEILNYFVGNPVRGSNKYFLADSAIGLFQHPDTTNNDIEDDKIVSLRMTPVAHKTMKETMNEKMKKTYQNEPEPYGGSVPSGSSSKEENFESNKEAFYKHFKGVFNVN